MSSDRWLAPDLAGQVAVVTGASRGVGRGIAEVLAECGAKTYLVARSATEPVAGRTGTIGEVAESINSRGGHAVSAPADLSDDETINELFARIERDDGHLEILVNNAVAWQGPEPTEDVGVAPWMYDPPWKAPPWWWNANFGVGVRSHWAVTNAASPFFITGRRGVVFFTSERQPAEPGSQELVLDLRATTVERMAFLYSLHLKPHRVSSIFLYPGFARTDAIERSFKEGAAYFDGWTEERFYSETASIYYVGRAAAMLAADPDVLAKTGTLVTAHQAAIEYGFTDVSGAAPDPI
jgi:NAD(P)-dependent dehydrogenase (short-subunit alcohol dehydrogenase family)